MTDSFAPRGIFWRRLWSFLNSRTTIYLSWRHLLALMLAGLLIAWSGIRDWAGIEWLGPAAAYLVFFGLLDVWRGFLRALRRLYEWLFKPLDLPALPGRPYLPIGLALLAALPGYFLWQADMRLALLYGIAVLVALLALLAIHTRETAGGNRSLATVEGRLPVVAVLPSGQVVSADGSRAKLALLTQTKSGYKAPLAPADVTHLLGKFLAFLAQADPTAGRVSVKFFWLTDYHLGQLDLEPASAFSQEYVDQLRNLVQAGAQRARVVLTGMVYPPQVEERLAEWLAPLDLGLSPLGAYAAESLLRDLFLGESLLGQVQGAHLEGGNGLRGLPHAALRGFQPKHLLFRGHLETGRQCADVLEIHTPFDESKEALMRSLQVADGFVCVEVEPLPRAETASEYRGRLLAARVPGLGRPAEARALRGILERLEDRRSLDYLFQTRTYLALWGLTEKELEANRALAESYLSALDYRSLTDRALEASLPHWLPVLDSPAPLPWVERVVEWLAAPPEPPAARLLTQQMVTALHREEGSDVHLADARGRILLGRSITPGKEGLRYADFRADTGPVLLVSDQGGGKSSTLIIWFLLRLQLLSYKIIAINLKYSTRMQIAAGEVGGIVLHPQDDLDDFGARTRKALFSNQTVLYQPVKGSRPYAIADDPCLLAFVRILYEEWLPARETPAALVIDEIHRLLPKDQPLSPNAAQVATLVAEAFKDWAERKLVIAAATQTLRDLYGSNLGLALQKFRTDLYFQVGPEDRDALAEKGYSPALVELIVGERRRPRGYAVLVMPDGFYTTIKILATPEEKAIIQRLDVEETADATPQLTFR